MIVSRPSSALVGAILVAVMSSGCYDLSLAELQPGGGQGGEGPGEDVIDWVERAGGPQEDSCAALDVFSDGAVAAVGSYVDPIAFGEGGLELAGGGEARKGYVVRLTPEGAFAWAEPILGDFGLFLDDVVALDDGELVVVGSSFGALSVSGSPISAGSAGNELLLARYEAGGDLRKAVVVGGPDDEAGSAIAVAPGAPRRLAVAGSFRGAPTFGSAAPFVDGASGADQAFVAVFDDELDVVWAQQVVGPSFATDVAVVGDEVIVVGSVLGDAVFDADEEAHEIDGASDAFVASYALDDGALRWVELFTGAGVASAWSVAADEGTIVACATYSDTIDLGDGEVRTAQGESDLLVVQLEDRNVSWTASLQSSGDPRCNDVARQSNGRVTMAGRFGKDLRVIDATGGETTASSEFTDGLLVSFASDGALAWLEVFGGSPLKNELHGVVASTATSLHACGAFDLSLDLGSETLDSAGGQDAFFMRLTPP